jgi:hypothetical protein
MADRSIYLTDANGTVYLAEPAGCWDPPDDFEPGVDDPDDWDRSGVFYDDEERPDGSVELYRLTRQESTP